MFFLSGRQIVNEMSISFDVHIMFLDVKRQLIHSNQNYQFLRTRGWTDFVKCFQIKIKAKPILWGKFFSHTIQMNC